MHIKTTLFLFGILSLSLNTFGSSLPTNYEYFNIKIAANEESQNFDPATEDSADPLSSEPDESNTITVENSNSDEGDEYETDFLDNEDEETNVEFNSNSEEYFADDSFSEKNNDTMAIDNNDPTDQPTISDQLLKDQPVADFELTVISKVNETVLIEPSTAIRLDYVARKAIVIPYSQRRLEWGKFVGLSIGEVKPVDFESNFINQDYETVYGNSSKKSVEIHMNFKKNYNSLSFGFEVNIGGYSKKSDTEVIETSLNIVYYKFGIQAALDNIFDKHSYVVPYLSAGLYQIKFSEKLDSVTNNGTTEISFYSSFGLMFAIDWLDPLSARDAYFESGIENTFLFVEATMLTESANEKDPNFGGLNSNFGIKVEF